MQINSFSCRETFVIKINHNLLKIKFWYLDYVFRTTPKPRRTRHRCQTAFSTTKKILFPNILGNFGDLSLPAQLINLTVGSKCQVLHSNCRQSFCNGSIWTSVEFVRDFEGFPGSFEFLGPARSAEAELPDPLLVEEPPILAFSICSCFSRSCWALPSWKKQENTITQFVITAVHLISSSK